MPNGKYSVEELLRLTGVLPRQLKYWIQEGLVPKPVGKGRGARYDERHWLRAAAVLHLVNQHQQLPAIKKAIAGKSDDELRALLPQAPRPTLVEGVPQVAPVPPYPKTTYELVPLMDGMWLLVDPSKGELLQRIAAEIHRHFGHGGG